MSVQNNTSFSRVSANQEAFLSGVPPEVKKYILKHLPQLCTAENIQNLEDCGITQKTDLVHVR